jgi:O-antigen ligase
MLLRSARIFLLGTLFAAPLALGAVQPLAWGVLGVAVAVLLLLWGVGCVLEKTVRVYWSPIYLSAAAFLALAAVQYAGALTLDRAATKEALCKLATDVLVFFLAGQLLAVAAGREWRKMGWAITLYAFAMGLFATLQFFSSHNLIYWSIRSPGYTFGPYVNHNHYAGLMEMLVPLAVAGVLPGIRKDASAVLLGFLVLIPIASLLLSGSRGGLVSLMVEVLLVAALVFLYAPRRMRKTAAAVGASAIFAAALLFFWMAPRPIVERLATMADATKSPEVTLAERANVARDALRIFRDRPWVGSGLGSFETVFPKYQSFPSEFTWDHAHNDYAEALAETGAAGGALILFALGLFFWLAGRNLRERLRHSVGWIQVGAALGCCGLLVHSFVDFNLHIPANGAWFATCAALATLRTPAPLIELAG